MIHPSYVELLKIMNDEAEENGTPHIDSRYSLVIAAAKRARQIIAGAEPLVDEKPGAKPLSIAVDEIAQKKVTVVEEGVDDISEHLKTLMENVSNLTFDDSSDAVAVDHTDRTGTEDDYSSDSGAETSDDEVDLDGADSDDE